MHGLPPQALVEAHLWIVDKFAAQYRSVAPRQCDLEAAGRLGLCEAACRFEPRKGASFKTYAWLWVKGAVLSEVRRAHVVPVPEHDVRAAYRAGDPVHGVVLFDAPEPESRPEQETESDREMQRRAVAEAVEALDGEAWLVCRLTLAGQSVDQIADDTGLDAVEVESLLEEARGELSWMLTE